MNLVTNVLRLFIFLCFTNTVLCLTSITLNGKWTVCNRNGSITVPATVPGSIYTDLLNSGIIDDPYNRNNSLNYRWVAYENWTFHRSFQLSDDFLQHHVVQLVLEGVDTVATVSVNGQAIANTDNMFRRYVVDVKKALQVGSNKVEVVIESPVMYAKRQASSYPYDVPEVCPPLVQQGECSFNFIRKEACSFSWDWGPAFPTSGIWRNISLEAYNSTVIRYVTTETHKKPGDSMWTLNGSVYFDVGLQERTVAGQVSIFIPHVFNYTHHITLRPQSPVHNFSVNIPMASILPWWPNGVGLPTLYDLHVTFTSENVGEDTHMLLHIGFRTVELVQTVLPQSAGRMFYFKINGVRVFMKGSNWIPADSFQERITPAYIHSLLQSAVDANMNMLRVWGGGVYESDHFYDLADQLGILLWQDFMFACSLYPTDQSFLTNVQSEITHQIRRLKHHPSIALWAGNNENEEELNHYRGQHVWKQYYQDYVTLNVNVVREIALTEDTSRPFVLSSPSNGLETTLHEGWVSVDPKDPRYGDSHHYNYVADSWDPAFYPVPRFASEYGRQSWCSFETYSKVSLPSDWDMFCNMTRQRNHRDSGNPNLLFEVTRHFILPTSRNITARFIDYIYLTQITQAVGIKTETELYRRSQSRLDTGGLGFTSGALYWQLNDIWQAPTWASIEYGGKWKMLHYFAKIFFNKILISPYLKDDTVIVYYIDDDIQQNFSSTEDTTKQAVNRLQISPLDNVIHSSGGGEVNQQSVSPVKSPTELEKTLVLTEEQEEYFTLHKDHDYLDKTSKRSETLKMHSQWKDNSVETNQDKPEITLYIHCFHWNNLKPSYSWKKTFSKPHLPSHEVARMSVTSMLSQCGCEGREHCFLHFRVEQSGRDFATNWLLLSDLTTAVGLHKASLKVTNVTQVDPQTLSINLTTDSIAPFVWLETPTIRGRFSNNGFIMVEPKKVLLFHAWDKHISIAEFYRCLTIKSLMDLYE